MSHQYDLYVIGDMTNVAAKWSNYRIRVIQVLYLNKMYVFFYVRL